MRVRQVDHDAYALVSTLLFIGRFEASNTSEELHQFDFRRHGASGVMQEAGAFAQALFEKHASLEGNALLGVGSAVPNSVGLSVVRAERWILGDMIVEEFRGDPVCFKHVVRGVNLAGKLIGQTTEAGVGEAELCKWVQRCWTISAGGLH